MPAGPLDVTLIVALYLGIMKASQPRRLKKTEKCEHSNTVSRAHSSVLGKTAKLQTICLAQKATWGGGGGTSTKSSRIALESSPKLCPSFP